MSESRTRIAELGIYRLLGELDVDIRHLETALASKERELEEARASHERDRAELIERAESGFALAETYKRELAEALERHGIQLAAISTACIQNSETSAKDRIGRENPYWTVAYGDVCVAIDREMKLRRELEEAMDKLPKQLEAFDAMKQVANDIKRERDEAREAKNLLFRQSMKTIEMWRSLVNENDAQLTAARSAIRGAVEIIESVKHRLPFSIRVVVLNKLLAALPTMEAGGVCATADIVHKQCSCGHRWVGPSVPDEPCPKCNPKQPAREPGEGREAYPAAGCSAINGGQENG